jgi:hypothetical protein
MLLLLAALFIVTFIMGMLFMIYKNTSYSPDVSIPSYQWDALTERLNDIEHEISVVREESAELKSIIKNGAR